MRMARFLCLLLMLPLPASTQSGRTVDELVSFIKSAIEARYDDKKVADEVGKIRLVNRLDDAAIQQVQHLGRGKRPMAPLHKLAEASAGLPAVVAKTAAPAAISPP